MSTIRLSQRELQSRAAEDMQDAPKQRPMTVRGRRGGRGRGLGRGRGGGRPGRIAGSTDTQAEGLVRFAETLHPVVFGSDAGALSDSGSASSLNSAQRNPMREARLKSSSSSSVADSSDCDESSVSLNKAPNCARRKRNQNTKQRGVSTRNRRSGTLPSLSPISYTKHLPPLSSAASQSEHHPLFLDMLQRRSMYRHNEASTMPIDTQAEDLQDNTRPPSTEIHETPGDDTDMQENDQATENENDQSFFRFIPSAHFQKRPRTPTSEVSSLSKAHCRYPGQSVRNQSGDASIRHKRLTRVFPTNRISMPESRTHVPGFGFGGEIVSWPWPPIWAHTPVNINQPRSLARSSEDEEATPRQSHAQLPPLHLDSSGAMPHQIISYDTSRPPASDHPGESDTQQETATIQMDQDEDTSIQEPELVIDAAACVETSLVNDLEHGLIPLMEYRHPELISPAIQEHIRTISQDVEQKWENSHLVIDQHLQDPRYIVEAFRTFTLPDLLFSISGRKRPRPSGNRHSSEIYLTIVTYLHLLGLRAVTSFRTGQWEMMTRTTSSCSLSNFAPLLASIQVPHNRAAKQIFVSNFLRAAHAKLYSIPCIGGGLLNEEKVGRAFEHALRVQIQIQKQYDDRQDERGVHYQQRVAAVKIGKWLMLHQVFWISKEDEMAALIEKMGPGVCSSDESDADTDGTSLNRQTHTSKQKVQLRSPEFAAFMDSIQSSGLYYSKKSSPFQDPVNPDQVTFPPPPPDGMPLTWISRGYMVDLMNIG